MEVSSVSKTLKQFLCKHKDSELIDLASHGDGVTKCYYICNKCKKGYVK